MATHLSDAGRTGDMTETLEMDWSYSPQTSRRHYATSLNLESRDEKEKRATEKRFQMSNKRVIPGDSYITQHEANQLVKTGKNRQNAAPQNFN